MPFFQTVKNLIRANPKTSAGILAASALTAAVGPSDAYSTARHVSQAAGQTVFHPIQSLKDAYSFYTGKEPAQTAVSTSAAPVAHSGPFTHTNTFAPFDFTHYNNLLDHGNFAHVTESLLKDAVKQGEHDAKNSMPDAISANLDALVTEYRSGPLQEHQMVVGDFASGDGRIISIGGSAFTNGIPFEGKTIVSMIQPVFEDGSRGYLNTATRGTNTITITDIAQAASGNEVINSITVNLPYAEERLVSPGTGKQKGISSANFTYRDLSQKVMHMLNDSERRATSMNNTNVSDHIRLYSEMLKTNPDAVYCFNVGTNTVRMHLTPNSEIIPAVTENSRRKPSDPFAATGNLVDFRTVGDHFIKYEFDSVNMDGTRVLYTNEVIVPFQATVLSAQKQTVAPGSYLNSRVISARPTTK